MEKPFEQLSSRSMIRLKVTPKLLREAADRLENELKNRTLDNQEAELPFSKSITFFSEKEPAVPIYASVTSDDVVRGNQAKASGNKEAVLN